MHNAQEILLLGAEQNAEVLSKYGRRGNRTRYVFFGEGGVLPKEMHGETAKNGQCGLQTMTYWILFRMENLTDDPPKPFKPLTLNPTSQISSPSNG